MKIKSLKIKNFRSLKEIRIEFADITAITGKNGSGKTTILEIVAAMLSGRTILNIPSDFYLKIELQHNLTGTQYKNLNKEAQKLKLDNYIYFSSRVCTIEFDNTEYNTNNLNIFKKLFRFTSVLANADRNMYLSNAEILNWRKTGFLLDVLDLSNSKKVLKAIKEYIHNEVYSVEQDKSGVTVVLSIIEKLNKSLEVFGLGNLIQFDPVRGILFTNRLVTYNKLPSGHKKLVIMLLYLSSQTRVPGILLIDEPEINLHNEWRIKLIKFLKEVSPKTQIIMATHDPFLTMTAPLGVTLDEGGSTLHTKDSYSLDEIMYTAFGVKKLISAPKQELLYIQKLAMAKTVDKSRLLIKLSELADRIDPLSALGIDIDFTKRRLETL